VEPLVVFSDPLSGEDSSHSEEVRIVNFPETRVAVIEHFGPPALEHETARSLIAWKFEDRLMDPSQHRRYGTFNL